MRSYSRRSFLCTGAGALLATPLVGCRSGFSAPVIGSGNPRLTARPGAPTTAPRIGEQTLGLSQGRDGLLFVPDSYDPNTPTPLLVMLHGATGSAAGLRGFGLAADSREMIVLIPESRQGTWDLMYSTFGVDVQFIDLALAYTFDQCNIDTGRIVLGGFSDGASYSLSLGVSNGDLFSHLIAFSPGFMAPGGDPVGRPEVFVSHGTADTILPVRQSRDLIVPTLEKDGYSVRYEQFEGGHTIPQDIARNALDWFLT